jgi:hypothetical protein
MRFIDHDCLLLNRLLSVVIASTRSEVIEPRKAIEGKGGVGGFFRFPKYAFLVDARLVFQIA